jgi:hypothetical protein
MFFIWRRWGRDEKLTIQTEFYPPENVSPSVSGYIIDDKLDKRDLTALVPYWGAGGYLKVEETEKKSLLGMVKNKEYTFIKVKELPYSAMTFERTLFNGIFAKGDTVKLNSLKDVLYKTMYKAKKDLESEVDKSAYYTKGSRGLGCWFIAVSIAMIIYGVISMISAYENLWRGDRFCCKWYHHHDLWRVDDEKNRKGQ